MQKLYKANLPEDHPDIMPLYVYKDFKRVRGFLTRPCLRTIGSELKLLNIQARKRLYWENGKIEC